MNLDTWQRIRDVFDAVIDLPAEQRPLALAVECEDETVRRKVESLILCEQGSGLVNLVQGTMLSADKGRDPSLIGNYKIHQRLGEGGMGVVYEAEQVNPKRKVAIKIMRSGPMASEREKRLFEREAEALGRLDHGGIAGIYESGLTAENQPYLVMEGIEGQTLSQKIQAEGPPPKLATGGSCTQDPPLSRTLRGNHLRASTRSDSSRPQAIECHGHARKVEGARFWPGPIDR